MHIQARLLTTPISITALVLLLVLAIPTMAFAAPPTSQMLMQASTAEMDVQGNGTSIPDGDTTPSTGDHTDFGSTGVAGGIVTRTFTITNNGIDTLNLGADAVSLSGANAADFSVTVQPATFVGGGGRGGTTFQITFAPSAAGLRTAEVSIANDDADESPYNFAIQGTGIAAGPSPEIDVQGNGISIPDGDSTPAFDDNTDFRLVDVIGGDSTTRTFTIRNTGAAVLTLGTNAVSLSGAHAADFNVIAQPATSVAAGDSTTFQIRFTPSALGTRTAVVSIANNDSDEATYNFAIQGTGTGEGVAPEMGVWGNGSSIADGDTTPSLGDHTDFGPVSIPGGSVTHTFTIENTAIDSLTLGSNAVSIGGTNAADFSVAAQPPTFVGGGGRGVTFQITFAPSADGLRTAEVSIINDDPDERPYNFSIQGTGASPEIDVQGSGVSIPNGDTTPTISDDTDFGSVDIVSGSPVTHTFTIQNTGALTLTLGADAISIGGANAADFSVAAQPATTLAASSSTTFQIIFDPSATGLRTAEVSITNDDLDESPYTFTIQGIGAEITPTPPTVTPTTETPVVTVTPDAPAATSAALDDQFPDELPNTGGRPVDENTVQPIALWLAGLGLISAAALIGWRKLRQH